MLFLRLCVLGNDRYIIPCPPPPFSPSKSLFPGTRDSTVRLPKKRERLVSSFFSLFRHAGREALERDIFESMRAHSTKPLLGASIQCFVNSAPWYFKRNCPASSLGTFTTLEGFKWFNARGQGAEGVESGEAAGTWFVAGAMASRDGDDRWCSQLEIGRP